MKNIAANDSLLGLNVTFAEGVDFTKDEGKVIQVFLQSRNTSVPMIVTASDSDAKKGGSDGIFVMCSDKCAEKMRRALIHEQKLFKDWV